MSCNNTIPFESLIKIPKDFKYTQYNSQYIYNVCVNTDNLLIDLVSDMIDYEDQNIICPNKVISGKVELYEARVSGYLSVSLSVKCLKSSANFVIEDQRSLYTGYVTETFTLVPSFINEQGVKVNYVIANYHQSKVASILPLVKLKSIDLSSYIDEYDNEFILVSGNFEITTLI